MSGERAVFRRVPTGHAIVLALAAAAAIASALSVAAPVAYRIEVHPIVTYDMAASDLLAGKATGSERTIAGELRLPDRRDRELPAVVLMHGDGGPLSEIAAWIDALNALGIATFNVDSFSGRGAISADHSLGSAGAVPPGFVRVVDAYRALAVLGRHPRIDRSRIALMGFSGGARATTVAATTRFATLLAPPGLGFAAFVALYPPCNVSFDRDNELVARPLRILHGTSDIITRIDACRAWRDRTAASGADVELVELEGAAHGFDVPLAVLPSPQAASIPNFSMCRLTEKDGRFVNRDTGNPVTPADTCVSRGLAGGFDEAADVRAKRYVRAFIEMRIGRPR